MNQNTEEKNQYQAKIFANRLSKKYKLLRKWARKNRVTCYRLYDRDIPEVPVAVDLYEFLPDGIDSKIEAAKYMLEEDSRISANDPSAARQKSARSYVHLYLYERPYEKDEKEEEFWLDEISAACAEVLGISETHVIRKLRKRQKGESQYEKIESKRTVSGFVQECGQLFKVNLSDYLDTGLFFDHRPLRSKIRASCAGKSVLNLYSYTASFSVYAAEGGASRIESVDLSNTYTEWAKYNFALNDFDPDDKRYVFTRSDAGAFLDEKNLGQRNFPPLTLYDIIILDPPTFSNSKNTRNTLDINRDWPELVEKCIHLLSKNGVLYFSTNSRRLKFDERLIYSDKITADDILIEDITEESIPEDYKVSKSRRCWKISRKK